MQYYLHFPLLQRTNWLDMEASRSVLGFKPSRLLEDRPTGLGLYTRTRKEKWNRVAKLVFLTLRSQGDAHIGQGDAQGPK
jgi:hypothetical protein